MDPFTTAMIASAIPKAMQIGTGIAQRRKGKKIKPRALTLSEERKKALKDARTRASSTKLAGQDRIEEGIEESTSRSLTEATESAGTPQERMAVAQSAAANEAREKRALGVKAAEVSESRAERLSDEEKDFGTAKERLTEKLRGEEVDRKEALEGAGATNIYQGMKGLASTAIGAAEGGLLDKDSTGDTKSTGEGNRLVGDTEGGLRTGESADRRARRKARREEEEEERMDRFYQTRPRKAERKYGSRY